MAYDHEAVDSFVKGRDNKPRFAWVIRSGWSIDGNYKKRYRCIRTTENLQSSNFSSNDLSLFPPTLERERRKKGKIDSRNFCFRLNETQSPRSRGWERAPSSIGIALVISRLTRSKCFETMSSVSHRFSTPYRKSPRRKDRPILGEDFKMGSRFGRARRKGWLEDGKWDKLDRWKRDIELVEKKVVWKGK